ncbi:MAG: sulfatase-like hydrolase/transferase [Candidatus Omnitrophica bacterium]|nr:sulfatase-like hydrolase/transferase [Candidatus Omnitrophota bacterium]
MNVLGISSDQHNASCFGFEGRNVKTPTLDKLAENGVVFKNAYCNNPVCAPSRISFITGTYPRTHRCLGNFVFDVNESNLKTISYLARSNGYQTALIGKGHMVNLWDKEGFEYIRYCDLCDSEIFDPLSCHYFKYLYDNGIADLYDQGDLPDGHPGKRTQTFISQIPHKHSLEVWTANQTIEFLENRDQHRPFFILMSFQRPHAPIAPSFDKGLLYKPEDIDIPENALDLFERKFASKPDFQRQHIDKRKIYPYVAQSVEELKVLLTYYYTLITIIDEEIGRVVKFLEEKNLLENTIIVYTSDHGDFAGEHGLLHKNLGIYESIHRIPFIIRYPGCPKGKIISELVESIDLYPTLCDLTGIKVPAGVEGISIIPIIEENKEGKKEVFCEWYWSYPFDSVIAIRTKDFRMVYYGSNREGELYDLRVDKGELINQYNNPAYKDIRLSLVEKIVDYVSKYEKKTTFFSDKQKTEQLRLSPRILLHKMGKRWSDIEKIASFSLKKE